MGSLPGRSQLARVIVKQIQAIAFSTDMSFYKFGHPPLPSMERETPLCMISLTNVNVSYQRVTPTWFSESFPHTQMTQRDIF